MGLIVSCFEKERICYEQLVKTEQLTVGRIYTYKELCQLFEEDEKTSDSRAAQKKEWARYFRWSNPTSRKYQIEEIYEVPREKQDGRKNNGGNCTSKYLSLDDKIMSCMNKKHHTRCTISSLLVVAGLLSAEYIVNRRNHKSIEDAGFSKSVINHVYWKMENVLNAGKSSLERLRRDGYLRITPRIVLVGKKGVRTYLSEARTQMVEEIRVRVRNEMMLKQKELYKADKRKEYEGKVIECIETELNEKVRYYYRIYEITRTDKEYSYKSVEDIRGLTRRFVKTICMSMLEIKFRNGFFAREDIRIQTARLVSRQFQHMSEDNWDEYFPEQISENWSKEEELFFWAYYYPYKEWLAKEKRKKSESQKQNDAEECREDVEALKQLMAQLDAEERQESEEQQEAKEQYRQRAVDELGEKKTQVAERIIPNLDWKRVIESESYNVPYMKYIRYLLDSYDNAVYMVYYVKKKEEKEHIVERMMNGAIQDYKHRHEKDNYSWLKDLDMPWTAAGLEI